MSSSISGLLTPWGILALLIATIGLAASFLLPCQTSRSYRQVLTVLAGGTTFWSIIGLASLNFGASLAADSPLWAKASIGPAIGVFVTLFSGVAATAVLLLDLSGRGIEYWLQFSRNIGEGLTPYLQTEKRPPLNVPTPSAPSYPDSSAQEPPSAPITQRYRSMEYVNAPHHDHRVAKFLLWVLVVVGAISTIMFILFRVGVVDFQFPGNRISMSNYEKIEDGMTEAKVTSILGRGVEAASSSLDVPGQSINIPGQGSASVSGMSASSKILMWQEDGKMITVQFMNGTVFSKSQFGL